MGMAVPGSVSGGSTQTLNIESNYGTAPGFGAWGPAPTSNPAIAGSGTEGAAGAAASEPIALTKAKFGHTFDTHGEDATEFLTNRAKGSNMPQGQFLDNQAAARFILENVDATRNGPVSLPIPEGLPTRVIMPDGSYAPASTIRLVPGGRGVKTAYPES
jgi:hypothetical protein